MKRIPSHAPAGGALPAAAFMHAVIVLVAYASLVTVAAACFLAGIPLGPWQLFVAAGAGVGAGLAWAARRLRPRHVALSLAALVVVLGGAVLASSRVYDSSHDGRDYHRRAAVAFASGLNPYRELAEPTSVYYNRWINHFPRAPWVANAAAIRATGSLEVGKALNLWLIWAVFCLGFATLRPFFSTRAPPLLIASAAALNPVASVQALSGYVDGQAAMMATVLLLLGLRYLVRPAGWTLLLLGVSLVVGLNVKFTLTGLIAVWSPFGLAAAIWAVRARLWPRATAIRTTWAVSLAASLGVFLVGWTPYVRNQVDFGNPFYPMYGAGEGTHQVDPDQISADFLALPAAVRVAHSLFGYSHNPYAGEPNLSWKPPFVIDGWEIGAFRDVDVRLGGLGPWFGGALLLSLLSLWLLRGGPLVLPLGALLGALALPLFLNEGGWWVRFHPQLWLVPVAVGAALLRSEARRARFVGYLVLSVLLVNSLLVTTVRTVVAVAATRQANLVVDELAKRGGAAVMFQGLYVGSERLLEDRGLRVTEAAAAEELPCPPLRALGVLSSPATCPGSEGGSGPTPP